MDAPGPHPRDCDAVVCMLGVLQICGFWPTKFLFHKGYGKRDFLTDKSNPELSRSCWSQKLSWLFRCCLQFQDRKRCHCHVDVTLFNIKWLARFKSLMCISFLALLKITFFYLKGRVTTERENRQIFCLLVHSPNSCSGWKWASLKPGASLGLSIWIPGPKRLGHPVRLSLAIDWELDREWSSLDPDWSPYWMLAM